jgi:WD40 repeat protein
MSTTERTVRIFISSPGDVVEEREKARRVIDDLQRQFSGARLEPVLWEDLALPATASFQESIDVILNQQPIDIAVFVLWSRLGSPLGAAITRPDGTPYRSGTEREFDLMLAAFAQSEKQRPAILAYTRDDEAGFRRSLTDCPGNRLEEVILQQKLAESFIREQFYDSEGHNVRAVHSYREPVSFAQRLHTHLRTILADLLGGEAAPRWTDEPYRGLEFFDLRHAAIFHGRDEETCDVLQRLRDQQQSGCAFTVIVGASGSGKSSLARAGVAAALVDHSYDDGVKQWRVVPFVAGLGSGELCGRLARTLAEQLPELRSTEAGVADLADGLTRDPVLTIKLAIAPAFVQAAEKLGGPLRLLLLVDQMEELWTDRRLTDEDRSRFFAALEALARSGHVAVLATLRSDFYPHAQREPGFLRLKSERGHYDLLPPGPAALRRLITEPARLSGWRFERDERTGRTLDEVILQDATHDPAALPLLQYALSELVLNGDAASRLLTFEAYRQMGGVEGALGRRAADTFAKLPDDARAALTEILPLLVTIDVAGEQAAVRRRAPLAELTATPARRALTESLIAARFLTTDRQDDIPVAGLAHEALLRRWDQLAGWLTANREQLQRRARVEQSQRRWEQQARDNSLLLAPGLQLEEARQLHTESKALLSAETAGYILTSIMHHEALQRRNRLRRRAVMAAMSVLTVLAVAGGYFARLQQREAEEQREFSLKNELKSAASEQTAIAARNGETEKLKALTRETAKLAFHQGCTEWDAGRIFKGERQLYRAYALSDTIDQFRQSYLQVLLDRFQLDRAVQVRHDGVVEAASFSPDGTRIITASADKTARIWDATTGKPFGEPLRHDETVRAASFSPDGKLVVTASADKKVRIWDATTGRLRGDPLHHDKMVWTACFSPDGTRVVTVSGDNKVRIWDATTGKPLGEPLRHDNSLKVVSMSRDGTRIVTAFSDMKAQIWDAKTGKPLGEPFLHDTWITAASISPDGTRIVTIAADRTARMWDANTGKPFGEFLRHDDYIASASFSPDGTRIITASSDKTARIWDARTGQPVGEALPHDGVLKAASFSPDGTRIVTISADKTARLWDATTGKPLGEPLRHDNTVLAASFSPDGTRIVSASADQTARIWDAGTRRGEPLRHDNTVLAASFSPDGTRMVSASADSTARVWDATTGKPRGEPLRHDGVVNAATFSPDGTHIVTGSRDKTARIWNSATGKPCAGPLRHDNWVVKLSFSPDGTRIVTVSADRTARIWDAVTGEPLGQPLRHDNLIAAASFSPDGTRIVTACWDSAALIWDVASSKPLGRPLRHNDVVEAASFSTNGARIVTASRDNTARIWDSATGEPLGQPLRHDFIVMAASFSADGTRIVTASADKTARIWDATTGKPLGEPLHHDGAVAAVSFNYDGTRIVTASYDQTSRIWDAWTGTPLGEPLHHDGQVHVASFAPDGTRIVTVPGDDTARIWDVRLAPRPREVSLWIECRLGGTIDAQGEFVPFTPAELEERRTRLYADTKWLTAYTEYRESIVKNAREQLAREAAERKAAKSSGQTGDASNAR